MRKFYVFDAYDCFAECDTLEEASSEAAWLVAGEFEGVHIKEFTEEEFEAYCKG